MSDKKPIEPDVPNARWWAAMNPEPAKKGERQAVALECERFFDARCVAQLLLRVPNVVITPIEESTKPAHRVQVRWQGTAAGRVNSLHLQVREVRGGNADPWRDL